MKARLRLAGIVLLLFALVAGGTFYWNPLWVNDQQIRYHLWRAGVRSEYIDVDGHRIHTFEAAPPDGTPGKPLLLLHGLGSRGEDWAPLIPGLAAAGFHVYAPDLLGYGRSEKPQWPCCSIEMEEHVVFNFMRATGLDAQDPVTGRSKPIDLAGWSMGGWIAAKLALDEPDFFDRLVLYDSAGITIHTNFPRDAFVPTDAAGLARLMALLMPHPRTLPGFVARATLRKLKNNGRIVQQSMDSMQTGAGLLDTRLSEIRQPTLVMWGMADILIPPAIGETMHREIPHSVFEGVAGCGHLAPSQCAKPVLTGTIQFLKAQPPMQGGEQMLSGDTR
ncbi:MAG: alpha/beta hydrolase [Acidobacteriaceae bacterium]|jgi:pimeloyl-ACP methyl ester carboxylesterase